MEIFRAISKEEKVSLEINRKFIPKDGAYEAKLFAQSSGDALKFGESFFVFERKAFYVVKVEIPDDFSRKLQFELLDGHLGVDASICVDRELLEEFNNNMTFEIIDGPIN